ncbi:MAG: T9SS type A sorting domain-containing protein [Bacteroidales bacterium]|nr:T9SS type A sorting domain-containing protein [Bacteroidales bacterium]
MTINEDTEIDYYRCIVNDEVVFHYSEYLDMNANIIINSNATLVLSTSCSIRFNEGYGIIIQPGGKLIINNASISNRFVDCGYWNGIEVMGSSNSPQTEEFQGTLYINNTSITRAKKSIFAHGGAIVKCNNTSFYNNNMHIKFDSYHNYPFPEQMPTYEKSNISSFTDCNFNLTSSYINHSNNEQDVNLYDVNGIVFAGCTFNKSEDLNNLDFIRQGISSCMASFTVKSSCTEPILPCPISTPSTFNNYDYSISSLGNSRNQIQVKDASFNKCKKGIYFLVVDNFKVINNTFQIVGDDVSSDYPPYGIYIDGGSDVFTLEGNTFGRLVSSGGSSAGVVVRDNHGANNTVYRNTFNNLRTSVHAIGENRGGANGLKITCNNFNSSRYDISTYSNESDANSGIAPYQGSITKDAGNEFSINTKIYHIWNDINCNSTNYYYSPDWISNSRFKPVSTYNTVKVLSTYMNSCPDNTGSGIIVIKSYLDITKTQIDSIAETLDNIVDGGNTSSTVAEIVLANDITAWETYISLIEKSPNLSIESLKEVASKETSLTAPMVRDVLVSNPQAAKSKEIEIILYERIDQLPDYMLEQIAMGVTDMSPKEYLELKQNVLISEFDQQISTGLEQLLLSDDIHIHDSIVSWLNYANTDLWKLHLVSYYKSKKMYPEAINCLQQIENQASMSEIYDIQSQISFYDQLQIWNNSSKSLINLQEADINFLTNFYYGDESSKSYYLAKVLLVANGEVSIDDRVYETPIMETRNTKQSILFDDNNMIIYPNPVTSFCTISYSITGIDSDYILVIADENGKILKEMQLKYSKDQIILNVSNLKSGTYTCSIKVGGQFKFSEKIIKI